MHHYFLYTVAANFYQGVIVFSYFSLCTDPPSLKENPEGGGGGGGGRGGGGGAGVQGCLYTGYRYFQLSPSHSSLGKVIFKVFLNVIVHDELPKLSQYFVGLGFIAFIISIYVTGQN